VFPAFIGSQQSEIIGVRNFNRYRFLYLPLILLVLLWSSCKTTKNTAYYRGWHNMNARFNGYYYSREAMKESVDKVDKANTDDFSTLIPLFVYPTEATAKNFFSDFDKSIKKSSSVIQRHCITDKRKKEIPNACKWIDENYVLVGQAHLYKRDLFSALETFEYVAKIYKDPRAKYNGLMWTVRANNEIGSYSLSESTLDQLRNSKDFPKEKSFQKHMAQVSADFYLKRQDYSPAAKELVKVISLTNKKKEKARPTYILAQLFEQAGNKKQARFYYDQIPKLHPAYEMVFNAQIHSAMLFDAQNEDSRPIKKQLNKMLADVKNDEYKDQIYFALAEIALQENDTTRALTYLDKSIAESKSNTKQKAISYLKRADIYFELTDYKNAQANYDSTMAILPKDFPNYEVIADKKKNLTELIINLNIIYTQDSLLALAKMSESERNKAIDKIIAKAEEDEKARQEEKERQENETPQDTPSKPNGGVAGNTGAWYFYNPTTVSFGTGEFSKKWGSRKLEDNWRRSDKDLVVNNTPNDEPTEDEEQKDSTQTTQNNIAGGAKTEKGKKNPRDSYLKNIPLTPQAQQAATNKIIDAYFNAGIIYKEQLTNNKKATALLEEMLNRYPDNKHRLSVYYLLYRSFMAMNNTEKANTYKNLILHDFANTEYAKIIGNPEYAKEASAKKSEVEKFYTQTYQLYSEANYTQALANCIHADTSFGKNAFAPQFFFLKALCIGRTQDITSFESALNQVVIKYPKEPVKEKAQEMLDAIKRQRGSGDVTKTDSTQNQSKFVFQEDSEYYWVTVVENGKGNINDFKIKLSDTNTQSFSADNLEVSSIFLDINHQMVCVKAFNGKAKAMVYYNFFKDDQQFFMDLNEGTYQTFIISADNYSVFYKDKNVADYQTFFAQYFK
jgi:tetratricopeptide (TPR) repeat protein